MLFHPLWCGAPRPGRVSNRLVVLLVPGLLACAAIVVIVNRTTPGDARSYSEFHAKADESVLAGDFPTALACEIQGREWIGTIPDADLRFRAMERSLERSANFSMATGDIAGSIEWRKQLIEHLATEPSSENQHALRLHKALIDVQGQIERLPSPEREQVIRAKRAEVTGMQYQFYEMPWQAIDELAESATAFDEVLGPGNLLSALATARWLELKFRYSGVEDGLTSIQAVENSLIRWLGEDHLAVVEMRKVRGTHYEVLGDAGKMAEAYGEYLAHAEKILGPCHPSIARAWIMRGFACSRDGDFAAAGNCFDRAESLIRQLPGDPTFDLNLLNFYRFDYYLGQDREGEVIVAGEQSIKDLERLASNAVPDWNGPSTNSVRWLMAAICSRYSKSILYCPAGVFFEIRNLPDPQQEYSDQELFDIQINLSLKYIEKAQDILEQLKCQKSLDFVWVLANQSEHCYTVARQGPLDPDWEQADRLIDDAITTYAALAEQGNSFQMPRLLLAKGLITREMGDPRSAISIHEQAVKAASDNSIGRALAAMNLREMAVAWHQIGDSENAHQCMVQCLDQYNAIFYPSLYRHEGSDAMQLAAQLRRRLRDLVHVTEPANQEQALKTFEYVTRVKGIVSRTMAARARVPDSPQVRSLRSRLFNVTQDLSSSRISNAGSGRTSELEQMKKQLVAEAGRLVSMEEFQFETRSLARLQQVQPRDIALVEFYWQQRTDFVTTREYFAFVVTRDGEHLNVEMIPLGPSKPIDDLVESIYVQRSQLAHAGTSRGITGINDRNAADMAAAKAKLKAMVWSRIEPFLAGRTRVITCGDGHLDQVAWCELPGPQPGTLLLDEYHFSTSGNIRELIELLELPPSTADAVLAVGGLDYGDATNTNEPGFGSLPESRREIDRLAGLFAPRHVTLLTGVQATEAAVRQQLQQVGIACFATHGHIVDYDRQDVYQHPFSSCALVLSRANDSAGKAQDGLLTGEEIITMDLQNIGLVMLSACGAGGGRQETGEGIMGVQRAMMLAGARCCLASAWSVDDADAEMFINRFTDACFNAGQSKLQALRTAQMAMRELYPAEPERWANWKLSGDWR